MFLQELLKKTYLKEEDLGEAEILILPKGIKAGIDCNLVMSRVDFEELMVNFRTREPASEGILMTIGTTTDINDPVWKVLIQSDAVAERYVELSNQMYAEKAHAEEPESAPVSLPTSISGSGAPVPPPRYTPPGSGFKPPAMDMDEDEDGEGTEYNSEGVRVVKDGGSYHDARKVEVDTPPTPPIPVDPFATVPPAADPFATAQPAGSMVHSGDDSGEPSFNPFANLDSGNGVADESSYVQPSAEFVPPSAEGGSPFDALDNALQKEREAKARAAGFKDEIGEVPVPAEEQPAEFTEGNIGSMADLLAAVSAEQSGAEEQEEDSSGDLADAVPEAAEQGESEAVSTDGDGGEALPVEVEDASETAEVEVPPEPESPPTTESEVTTNEDPTRAQAVSRIRNIIADFLSLSYAHGVDVICASGNLTLCKLLEEIANAGCYQLDTLLIESGYDDDRVALRLEEAMFAVRSIAEDFVGSGDYDGANAVLVPIMKLIYEEEE